MNRFMYVSLAFFFASPLFGTEAFEIEQEDGSKLTFYLDTPKTSPFSITLIIPGSQNETTLRLHESLQTDLTQTGRGVLTLEKVGLNSDKSEFNRRLSLDSRLQDHLELLESLKNGFLPDWDGKLSILGQGDGGRIGARLATLMENIEALILIAAGGAWSPLEETLYSFRSEMVDSGYSPQYIHGFLVQAKQEFAQAKKNPKSDLKAFGYTYKYWESLFKTNLLEDLTQLNCPIYSVNGVADDRVPIESVDAMAKLLHDKLTLLRVEKAGREIIQDPKTYQEAISWMQRKNF